MSQPLNAKQQKFVSEYLIDQNATRAARAAGYSENSADVQGSRLLGNDSVVAAIKKGIDAQIAKTTKLSDNIVFTKAMWLRELKIIAMSNIDDFITIDEEEIYKDSETDEPVMRTTANAVPTKKRRSKLLGKAIKKINETKNGIGIELHSKQAALDTLGRHFGWVKNDVQVTDPNEPQVILTMPSNGREAPPEDLVKTDSEGKESE